MQYYLNLIGLCQEFHSMLDRRENLDGSIQTTPDGAHNCNCAVESGTQKDEWIEGSNMFGAFGY